jgi:predicted regulator of Ras-like GTPase activity (Roadblock/LC7/MglB family)
MEPTPMQQAALHQLAAVPGVVGGVVFDPAGAVVASEFPPVFDQDGLRQLAGQLSSDGYFQEWLADEHASLDLRYGDGHVVVRSLAGQWLLVVCTPQANTQLLSMSLTQVVRRLRVTGEAGVRTGELALPAATPPPAPTALDKLRAIAIGELGAHAEQALEILAAAGTGPKELLRATADIEKMTRLFISKKKADEIGQRMREQLVGAR